MGFEREIEFALRTARQSGELALAYAAQGIRPENKADDSPVTIADKESERLIAAVLNAEFPDDGLLGEEGVDKESTSGRRWIIDPIDGTRDFVRGNPFWCVMIGLEDEAARQPVAGVCHFPVLGESYTATKAGGTWCNGVRLHVSDFTDVSQSVMLYESLHRFATRELEHGFVDWTHRFWSVRSYGGAYDAMVLARGQAEVWVEPAVKPWDLVALKILVEEAGARFFNFDGASSIYGGNCIGCVPGVEAEVRQFFGIEK